MILSHLFLFLFPDILTLLKLRISLVVSAVFSFLKAFLPPNPNLEFLNSLFFWFFIPFPVPPCLLVFPPDRSPGATPGLLLFDLSNAFPSSNEKSISPSLSSLANPLCCLCFLHFLTDSISSFFCLFLSFVFWA
ncbi:hypothetical protein TorRG33x02_286110 [Trema orientale]|uniref:Transmembrane protein n=1 Tax=Trema orientale TaxID=63057 RepID=A0A2P5CG26_TREOI|nr:hypothetical protein TorRG33x02_286110 [Trema orientale]